MTFRQREILIPAPPSDVAWGVDATRLACMAIKYTRRAAVALHLFDEMTAGRGLSGLEPIARMPRMVMAEAFVFSLAIVRSSIGSLADRTGLDGVATALARIDETAPRLQWVRNSLSHVDERALGLTVGKKPMPKRVVSVSLERRPTMTEGLFVLVGGGLTGRTLRTTVQSGEIGEVQIDHPTLVAVEDAVDMAMQAVSGERPGHVMPWNEVPELP